LNYPKEVRAIELPCTGRIDVTHILAAFERGADGVFVAGCTGDKCHFIEGTDYAKAAFKQAQGVVKAVGLEPERLQIVELAGDDAKVTEDAIAQVVETVKGLPPSPVRKG